MKTIPDLIRFYGTMAEAARQSGISEMTIAKYRDDVHGDNHVIHNDRLMIAHQNSRPLFTRDVKPARKYNRSETP